MGVLCAVRPIEDEDPVLAELLADPATTIVRPSALSVAAVTDLVREELSADADEAFCVACHRATGGNPLLLEELIRTVAAEQVAPSAGSVEVLERLAPDAVARSVKLRLARLPAEAAALARAVAVLGDGADRPARAPRWPGSSGVRRRPRLRCSRGSIFCCPDPPLRFVHPLVRNAVYEASPPHERAQQHAQAAAVLAAAGAPVEQIAGQLLHAPPESVEERGRAAAGRGTRGRGAGGSRQRGQIPEEGAGGADAAMPSAPSCCSSWPRRSRAWAPRQWSRGCERRRASSRTQSAARWQSSISDGRSIGPGRRRKGCKCSSGRSRSGRSKTTWAGGCKPS